MKIISDPINGIYQLVLEEGKIGGFLPLVQIFKKDNKYGRFLEWGSITYGIDSPNMRSSVPSGHRLCTLKVWYYSSYIYLFINISPLDSNGTMCKDFSDYIRSLLFIIQYSIDAFIFHIN